MWIEVVLSSSRVDVGIQEIQNPVDFTMQAENKILHRRPSSVITDKEKRECKMTDITLPVDHNINTKKLEKITKYEGLRLQVQSLWNVKATVIPFVIGALGTICDNLEKHLRAIGISITISCLQGAALLGTAFILTRFIGISESE